MNKTKKLRSQEWFGGNDKMGFVHRSWLRIQGYPDDYFRGKPVIGINPLVNATLFLGEPFIALLMIGMFSTFLLPEKNQQ